MIQLRVALLPRFICLIVLFLQPFFGLAASAQPQLVASVKPLQLIAAAITDGVSSPSLLIGAGQDPHHPALRPSERRALAEADMMLWVGPQLETALSDLFDVSQNKVITAYTILDEAGLTLADTNDPHLWLSTQNARLIAQVIARRLQAIDSDNRARYANNLNSFFLAMDALDMEITERFNGLTTTSFAVYHNAFNYFERQFDLQHLVSFTDNQELQPGVRKILEIRETLAANDISCLIIEPENNPAQLEQLVGREMTMVSVDVLGFAYPPGKTAYADFMRDLTGAVAGCFER